MVLREVQTTFNSGVCRTLSLHVSDLVLKLVLVITMRNQINLCPLKWHSLNPCQRLCGCYYRSSCCVKPLGCLLLFSTLKAKKLLLLVIMDLKGKCKILAQTMGMTCKYTQKLEGSKRRNSNNGDMKCLFIHWSYDEQVHYWFDRQSCKSLWRSLKVKPFFPRTTFCNKLYVCINV